MQDKDSASAITTLIAASLLTIATFTVAVALSYTRAIMIPFVIALFLSYFITPIVATLRTRARLPHWLAVILTIFLFFLSIGIFFLLIRESTSRMIDNYYLYEAKLSYWSEVITKLLTKYGVKTDQKSLLGHVKELPVFSYVQSAAGTAFGFIIDFLLVTVFLIFLVSGQNNGQDKGAIGEEIDAKIRSYILTKIASCLITSILIWIILASFNLEMSLMFALLSFFLSFIPTLGPIVATLLPLPVALFQFDDQLAIWAIVLIPGVLQVIVGNVIEPKLFGKGLGLHPIAILLSLMFWGLIWGIAGMFLAVPITAVIKIILERIPLTRRVSGMMEGHSPFQQS